MKEVATIRRPLREKNVLQNSNQIPIKSLLYGRSIGRVKVTEKDQQVLTNNNKSKVIRNKSQIKLVRLKFYVPHISKEIDVGFNLDEVNTNYRTY